MIATMVSPSGAVCGSFPWLQFSQKVSVDFLSFRGPELPQESGRCDFVFQISGFLTLLGCADSPGWKTGVAGERALVPSQPPG